MARRKGEERISSRTGRHLEAEEVEQWNLFVRGVTRLKSSVDRQGQEHAHGARAKDKQPMQQHFAAPLARGGFLPETMRPQNTAAQRWEIGSHPGGLDRSTWKSFSSGMLRPQAKIDLHGLVLDVAFARFDAFMHATLARRLRCIEIISGQGRGEGGGVIRRELPRWLAHGVWAKHILAVTHPHPANRGALRILLRRQRD